MKMLSSALGILLALMTIASAGEKTGHQNLPSTPQWSRSESRSLRGPQRFSYRGGVVNYWPSKGSQWTPTGGKNDGKIFADTPTAAALPNGCLVYACARAEQIRLNSSHRETKSNVITYRRADGSGHAFVVYKKDQAFIAEDNCGNKTRVPAYENRSRAEALYLAQTFQRRTGSGISMPVQAAFVGSF
jgi:hypothetical protein